MHYALHCAFGEATDDPRSLNNKYNCTPIPIYVYIYAPAYTIPIYDLSINKYKEIEREKVEYEPVESILERLNDTEDKYLKGYKELCNMLEVKE